MKPIIRRLDKGRVSISCPSCVLSMNAPQNRETEWVEVMEDHIKREHKEAA